MSTVSLGVIKEIAIKLARGVKFVISSCV